MWLVLFWVGASFLGAQQASSSAAVEKERALLLAVRQKVMQTVNRLPKYMCTETVDRATLRPEIDTPTLSCDELASKRTEGEWRVDQKVTDRLRLDVAVSRDGEMYSWVGEHRFSNRNLADLVGNGATSTGTFSSFLNSIFGTNNAQFTYAGEVMFAGQRATQFGFRVPRDRSEYTIGNKEHHAIVGYSGTFFVRRTSADLVRLTVRADQLPPEINVCQATTTLDYDLQRLNEAEFLLPKNVAFRVANVDGSEYENKTVFSGCHEYLGESTLRFDMPASNASVDRSKAPSRFVALPPDLPFTIVVTEPIDTATAAAGDLVEARLKSAIRGHAHEVLLPKGTAVTARILHIERSYEGASRYQSLSVSIKVEAAEASGVEEPFEASLDSAVKRRVKNGLPLVPRELLASPDEQKLGLFDEMSDASTGILQFEDVTPDYVIRRGLELSGHTDGSR